MNRLALHSMTDISLTDMEKQPVRGIETGLKTKILVVDDEQRICESLKTLLEQNGYDCFTANGGKSAINTLQHDSFDLILLDLKMPGVDGHQVLEFAKLRWPDTDFIVVSGETTFNEASWALQQGAHDFIRKPYVINELIHSIDKTVNRRRLETENREMQRQLTHSEWRHRFFVNKSPDIIYMLDRDGYFRFINDRVSPILGYTREELLGRHYSAIVFPDDLELARLAFEEKNPGQQRGHSIEFRLLGNGGEARDDLIVMVEQSAIGTYAEPDSEHGEPFRGTYGVLRDITERKRAEETIEFQLYHDLLTTLPNRGLFRDRLEMALSHAKRNKERLAVLFLDLDGFKVVNDSLGHLTGDQVLQAVALRLCSCLREGDTLARVGGDEFNLLLPEIRQHEDVIKIAEKLINTLKTPFILEKNEVFVTISIGIAMFPDDGQTIEALVKNADLAMYHIKGRGKNGYQFFADKVGGGILSSLPLERGLRRALNDEQLVLHYQPQVDINSGRIVGVEALVRWQHPEAGLIPPGDFIPLAEEIGLISQIGEWVLDEACAEFSRWHQAGVAPDTMAVNLSTAQLYRSDFVPMVLDVLRQHNMSGEHLELEITENLLMHDMEHVVQKLLQLSAHGIGVAVDDFGTGYSSLGYLETLPLHTLKMDRSFIRGIKSADEQYSIINAIVAMAKGLDLEIVAEGVEEEVQLEYLRSLDCFRIQGFLFSRPLPAEDIFQILLSSK
jgi:diguanylate cyclase (GGDEF)-like protein/PAS domain S-box-containing protein